MLYEPKGYGINRHMSLVSYTSAFRHAYIYILQCASVRVYTEHFQIEISNCSFSSQNSSNITDHCMKAAMPLCDKWALYKYHGRLIAGLGQVPRIHLAKKTVTVLQQLHSRSTWSIRLQENAFIISFIVIIYNILNSSLYPNKYLFKYLVDKIA